MVDVFHWNKNDLNSLNINNMKVSLLDKKEKMVPYLLETIFLFMHFTIILCIIKSIM